MPAKIETKPEELSHAPGALEHRRITLKQEGKNRVTFWVEWTWETPEGNLLVSGHMSTQWGRPTGRIKRTVRPSDVITAAKAGV